VRALRLQGYQAEGVMRRLLLLLLFVGWLILLSRAVGMALEMMR
jgi:hypothetical protein